MHLKSNPYDTLQFKASQTQELSPKKSPLGQLVLKRINPVTTNIDQFQTSTVNQPQIRINQITKQCKNSYLEQHKLECHWALKREYKLADYLSTVRDSKQRQILTKYRLSDHSLAIEKGRHKNVGYQKSKEYVVTVRQVRWRQRCTFSYIVKNLKTSDKITLTNFN